MGGALALFAALGGCIAQSRDEAGTEVVSDLYVATGTIWASADIPVCWENAGNDTEKAWVRDALSKSWEAEGNVTFVGFGPCTGATTHGVRIRTADEWPHTNALGRGLDNLSNGMLLNFWFTFTDPNGDQPFGGCLGSAREGCIRSIAVHEFGHALGFAHEQNRSDTPASCTQPAQGTNGDATVGGWDLNSIMDYCNPTYNNGGFPSPTDIWGLQQYYGGRRPLSVVARAFGRLDVSARTTVEGLRTWSWNGNWTSTSHANSITDTSALVATGASRVHAFVRGTDGALYTKTFDGTSWSNYIQLGSNSIVGNPVAVSCAPGRADVFVRGSDDALYTKSFDGASWSQTYTRVGWSNSPVAFIGTPAAVSRGPNRIDVFARSKDNILYYATWDGSSWSMLVPLSPLNPIASNPVAVSWDPSRIDVFVRGTDNALYTKSLTGSSWSNYLQLGSNPFTGDPAVVSWGPGRIDVFVRGTDAALYTKSWNGSSWSGYTQLGSNPILASPSAASWGTNRLDVFVRGTDNQLYTTSWTGTQWVGYAPLGGSLH